MSKQQINERQISEWTESPVTEALLELCKKELDDIRDTTVTDCYFPGDPQKTQENLIALGAMEDAWESWSTFLSGDWSELEEEDEDGE